MATKQPKTNKYKKDLMFSFLEKKKLPNNTIGMKNHSLLSKNLNDTSGSLLVKEEISTNEKYIMAAIIIGCIQILLLLMELLI